MALMELPTEEEIARVDAWRAERQRQAEERAQQAHARRACSLHGPGATGRIISGPAVWGGGPTCRVCRRAWSRQNGGKRWESWDERMARERREHAEMVAEVEAMRPDEFYAAWEVLRAKRHEETRRYHYDAPPDEFGVNHYGSATPDGQRYHAMRARVLRERRQFEEAHDVL